MAVHVLRDDFIRICDMFWFSLMLQLLGPGKDMVSPHSHRLNFLHFDFHKASYSGTPLERGTWAQQSAHSVVSGHDHYNLLPTHLPMAQRCFFCDV